MMNLGVIGLGVMFRLEERLEVGRGWRRIRTVNLTTHRGCRQYNASRGPVEGAYSQGTVSPRSP